MVTDGGAKVDDLGHGCFAKPTSYKDKADIADVEALDAWKEMSKVLAVIRATGMNAGAYLVVQRKLQKATLAIYAEGFDDGFRLSQQGQEDDS